MMKQKTLNPLMLCFEISFSLPQTQLMVANIYINMSSLQGWHYGFHYGLPFILLGPKA
jgi:hypothetical protein